MPSNHRRHAGWTIERITRDAGAIGATVGALCAMILERRPHPEQGFRACLGILKLERSVGAARLDAAAGRAIKIDALTYGSVKSILDNKLEQQPSERHKADLIPIRHQNIRGSGYFH
jgi:transposase